MSARILGLWMQPADEGCGVSLHPLLIAMAAGQGSAAATRKAKELGAKVMMDKTEIPDAGWMSVIVDPTGATIALWQPMPRQGGQKK